MRRFLAITILALLPVPALAAGSTRVELHAGDTAFLNGPKIEASAGERSFEYKIALAETGYRLRIGVDHPEIGDTFDVSISGPGASSSFTLGPGIYSEERLFEDPGPGTWTVRIVASDVTDSAFRVRAKLEARPPSVGTKRGPLLPNLQILPPHEASFLVPLTNGTEVTDPTGVDVAGQGGCHPEEHAEDRAVRCLRFAYGIRNTGVGPMELSHRGGTPIEHDLYQHVHHADGSTHERPAGNAVFHKTHGHWHHAEAVGLQLFSVKDPKEGGLEPAGAKRTKGFAHRNELLRDWDVFYPTLTHQGIGLRPGWADIYEWDRPGNYIDFGLNGDGYYVVRMWADPVDGILEMNERDNFGYTFMKIEGSTVELLEAGRGRDPWDPCKIVVGFGGHPDPESGKRPSHCPPDTT